MMKMISRVAFALALLVAGVGTTTLHADTFDRVAPPVVASGAEGGVTVRVTNNHGHNVRVYVVDSDHRRRLLGRVGPSKFKELQFPSGWVGDTGKVQIKVHPLQLGRVSGFEPAGIKTSEFSIQSDQVIELYLEADLKRSLAGISRS